MNRTIDRRTLLRGMGGGALAVGVAAPAWAQSDAPGVLPTVSGEAIELRVGHVTRRVDGKAARAIGINGTSPAPLIRLREGQRARIRVVNDLDVETSLHWHGLLVPFQYDGVPGVSFPGIAPGTAFDYAFPVRQNGTYWYHSHSAGQEQEGLYGPIVIDPADRDPVAYDREHVIVLSDHSRSSAAAIFRRMKVQPGYYNFQRQTLAGLLAGRDQREKDRLAWGRMRMDPADIADGTGATYTYLVNGHGPRDNWTGLFTPGERVRLRIINASAMTTFNVRIPGLPLTIVQADGLNVEPIEIDEFQIAVAETYDAIVTPAVAEAFTLVAESIDRSGMARATLSPRIGMTAAVPPLRPRPLATMTDMGMGGMDMGEGKPGAPDPTAEQNASRRLATPGYVAPPVDHATMDHSRMDHAGMDHAAMGHAADDPMAGMDHGAMKMRDFEVAPQIAKTPGVQTISPMPIDRTDYPGQGLEHVGHRVLTYRQLRALARNPDVRAPSRELEIHLTGNMERFMWGFDGERMVDTHHPFAFTLGERVRVKLVNDTMMGHPIHLHGHFFDLVTGQGDHAPRKHTVLVQPGGIVSFDLTADAPGDWAFHCHMLYHMLAGMMRVVTVRAPGAAA